MILLWWNVCQASKSDIAARRYHIEMDLSKAASHFVGAVNVTFQPRKECLKDFHLDAVSLNIAEEDIRLVDVFDGSPIMLEKIIRDNTTIKITTKSNLLHFREYMISLKFQGKINTDTIGIFRSHFLTADRQERSYLATNLYPAFARHVFPCVDEPSQQSNFIFSFIHNRKSRIIFNTMVKATEKVCGTSSVKTTFDTVEAIPVHLVAFVEAAGDFEQLHTNRSAKVTTWGSSSAKEALEMSHGVAAEALLQAEQRIIGVPLLWKHLNIVVLPNFPINVLGAGLILLSEEETSIKPGLPTSIVQDVIILMSEYVASQWAGSAIWPDSWTAQWIISGYKNLLKIRLAAATRPEWNVEIVEQARQINEALLSDEATRLSINDVNETTVLSDFVTAKEMSVFVAGASLLLMAENVLNSSFWKGTKRLFSRSSTLRAINDADFVDVMETQAEEDSVLEEGVTVFGLLNSWSRQTGYPVVSVIRNYDNGSTKITQERFILHDDHHPDESREKESWWIPLAATVEEAHYDSRPTYWLPSYESLQLENMAANDRWLYFPTAGPFRVKYDLRNWNLIVAQLLKSRSISSSSRMQLVTDALALARANLFPWASALDAFSYLKDEKEYIPWKIVLEEMTFLRERMRGSSAVLELFKKYMCLLTRNAFLEALHHFEAPLSHAGNLMNETIFWWACWAGLPDCNTLLDKYFLEWVKYPGKFPSPEVSASVLCSGVRSGNINHFEKILTEFKSENCSLVRTLYLKGLACAPDFMKSPLLFALVSLLNNNAYESDGVLLYKYLLQYSDNIGCEDLLDILEEHYQTIRQAARSDALMMELLKLHANRVNTNSELRKLEEIIESNAPGLKDLMGDSIRIAKFNIEWKAKHLPEIEKWLKYEIGGK